jgi:DNA repair protein RadC
MKRRIARKRQSSYKGKTKSSCIVCQQPDITKPLRSTQDIMACLKPFRDRRQEYFVTLSLDSSGRLIRRRVVTIGSLTSSIVHPREVFAGPLVDRAATVIVCHNHASGIPEPSEADIEVTQQLVRAGKILGVPVRDHLIVSKNEYFSFLEQGSLVE